MCVRAYSYKHIYTNIIPKIKTYDTKRTNKILMFVHNPGKRTEQKKQEPEMCLRSEMYDLNAVAFKLFSLSIPLRPQVTHNLKKIFLLHYKNERKNNTK